MTPLLAEAIAMPGNLTVNLLVVLLFLLGALVLLVMEFFIVSFGLLSLASLTMAIGAITYAFFQIGPTAGWITLAATPVIGLLVIRWGMGRLQRSHLVVQPVESVDAGIHHSAAERGITVGARGNMVTPGHPSGRARFAGGEADVAVQGGFLATGEAVEVTAIEGPSIFVKKLVEATKAPSPTDG